jgi:hypothetical protein
LESGLFKDLINAGAPCSQEGAKANPAAPTADLRRNSLLFFMKIVFFVQ